VTQRWWIAAAGLLVTALVASQLLLPDLAADEVEDRLTEGGGSAEVSLAALPALRLLFGDGDSFEVSASELDLELDQQGEVFDRLDGFGEINVAITDFAAGPFELESFALERDGSGPYRLLSEGTTTAAALLSYGAESLGLAGGPLATAAIGSLLDTDRVIPVELDMELVSDEGRVQVVSGGGTIAGLPTGPFAQLITSAIVVRL
jgi:hypothetical protein